MLVSKFLVFVKLVIFPHLASAYDSTVKKYLDDATDYISFEENPIFNSEIMTELEDALAYGDKYLSSFQHKQIDLSEYYGSSSEETSEEEKSENQSKPSKPESVPESKYATKSESSKPWSSPIMSRRRIRSRTRSKSSPTTTTRPAVRTTKTNLQPRRIHSTFSSSRLQPPRSRFWSEPEPKIQPKTLDSTVKLDKKLNVDKQTKNDFYEPGWMDTSDIGDFGSRISNFVNQYGDLSMKVGHRTESTTKSFPYSYVTTPTTKPPPYKGYTPINKIIESIKFQTTTEKIVEEKTTSSPFFIHPSVQTNKPSRSRGIQSDRFEDENVVYVDGLPTSKDDIYAVTSKKPYLPIESLLTPDYDVHQRLKQNKLTGVEENFVFQNSKKQESIGDFLISRAKTGYQSIMGSLRNIFEPATKLLSRSKTVNARSSSTTSHLKSLLSLPFAKPSSLPFSKPFSPSQSGPSSSFPKPSLQPPLPNRLKPTVLSKPLVYSGPGFKASPTLATRPPTVRRLQSSPAPPSQAFTLPSPSALLAPLLPTKGSIIQLTNPSRPTRRSDPSVLRQKDISIQDEQSEDFFSLEMKKFRDVFPTEVRIDDDEKEIRQAIKERRRKRINWQLKKGKKRNKNKKSGGNGSRKFGDPVGDAYRSPASWESGRTDQKSAKPSAGKMSETEKVRKAANAGVKFAVSNRRKVENEEWKDLLLTADGSRTYAAGRNRQF